MTTTGVSKRLCISIIGIQSIVHLADDTANKLWYGVMITGIVIVFKIAQVLSDRNKLNLNKRNEENG